MKHTYRILSVVLVLSMLLSMVPMVAAQTAAAEIYDLRVNDLVEPLGIDENPSFSWKMKSDAIGAAQTAYAITVSDGETAVWNSGWVEESDSTNIPYGGEKLEASKILLSIGRVADLECLGTLADRIKQERGKVVVDDYMRTTIPNIYAPGDINGRIMLAHPAFKMGEAAAACCMA